MSVRICAVVIAAGLGLAGWGTQYAEACPAGWDVTVGQPGINGPVHALAAYNDGSGPVLYVGGEFTSAGGATVANIARWNGTTWSAMGSGANSVVYALVGVEETSAIGPALYIGGAFDIAGGQSALKVVKWHSNVWSPLGTGMNSTVNDMAAFQGDLYATGSFITANGATANRIAKWNGSTWSPVMMGAYNGLNNSGTAMTATDAVSAVGPALYVGGYFTTAGGQAASRVAKWDGTNWSGLGTGTNLSVLALAIHDDGSGTALYAGGQFTSAGGVTGVNYIARWNGSNWSAVGAGFDDRVRALAVFDDGSGPALYAGGDFTMSGTTTVNHIARWNGTTWSALPTGANNWVSALEAATGTSAIGPHLYVGGTFTQVNSTTANRLARWTACLEAPGDCNGDGWVGLPDHARFVQCIGGPEAAPLSSPCDCIDLDEDGDVDLADWAEFQAIFTGPP